MPVFRYSFRAMRSPAIAALAPLTRRRAIDYVRCASCFCSCPNVLTGVPWAPISGRKAHRKTFGIPHHRRRIQLANLSDGTSFEGLYKNESLKAASNHLRGLIKEELIEDTPAFGDDSEQLLKFHGIYQQDDRDRHKEARARGLDKHHQLMIGTRIPGGIVSPRPYIAHAESSRRWANRTLRAR